MDCTESDIGVNNMVGLILSYNDFNVTTDEILNIKKLCNSFGIHPACSIDNSGINEQKIVFDFGNDIKRKDVFKRGLMRLLKHTEDLGYISYIGRKLPRLYYIRRTSCPWIR